MLRLARQVSPSRSLFPQRAPRPRAAAALVQLRGEYARREGRKEGGKEGRREGGKEGKVRCHKLPMEQWKRAAAATTDKDGRTDGRRRATTTGARHACEHEHGRTRKRGRRRRAAHYNAHELLRRPLSELLSPFESLCDFILRRP